MITIKTNNNSITIPPGIESNREERDQDENRKREKGIVVVRAPMVVIIGATLFFQPLAKMSIPESAT